MKVQRKIAKRSGRGGRIASTQVMGAQFYDALVTIPGCDKNMPGLSPQIKAKCFWGLGLGGKYGVAKVPVLPTNCFFPNG